MSAKRDKDFLGYSPFKEGSTIFDNASMSWSWGIAHLTKNCSARGSELQIHIIDGALAKSNT